MMNSQIRSNLIVDGLIKTPRSGKMRKATKTIGIIKRRIKTIRRIVRKMVWTLGRMLKRIARRIAKRIRSGTAKAKRTIRKNHIDHHLNLLFM